MFSGLIFLVMDDLLARRFLVCVDAGVYGCFMCVDAGMYENVRKVLLSVCAC